MWCPRVQKKYKDKNPSVRGRGRIFRGCSGEVSLLVREKVFVDFLQIEGLIDANADIMSDH
jgi:hypothetical protein